MTRAVLVVLLVIFIMGLSHSAFAKDGGDKFFRGAINVLTGVVEVPLTIKEEWVNSNNAAIGIFAGTLKGSCRAIGRTLSGVWDVLTFPFAIPKGYEPLAKPDYVIEKSEGSVTPKK